MITLGSVVFAVVVIAGVLLSALYLLRGTRRKRSGDTSLDHPETTIQERESPLARERQWRGVNKHVG